MEVMHRLDQALPDCLVIGIIGQGHLRYGHGVPRQLADLGRADPDRADLDRAETAVLAALAVLSHELASR
ncbi:MAG: hypothetical protein IH793_09195 [Acidobacteria bacterium]|nr:hypothetical protein [Acidobacteriota bacterium]